MEGSGVCVGGADGRALSAWRKGGKGIRRMLRVVEVGLSVKGLTRTVDTWGPPSLSGSGLLRTGPAGAVTWRDLLVI